MKKISKGIIQLSKTTLPNHSTMVSTHIIFQCDDAQTHPPSQDFHLWGFSLNKVMQ